MAFHLGTTFWEEYSATCTLLITANVCSAQLTSASRGTPSMKLLKWIPGQGREWTKGYLKKDLLQRGYTNPTPKCTLHMWVQMVACKVDGPSLQPSTWHLYTLLMPPNWTWKVACWQGSLPLKLKGQLKRHIPVPVLQEQRLQVPWIPEGADGKW